VRTRWTRKPPYGAPVDRGHPLAQGLRGFWSFSEGGGPVVHDAFGTNPLRWMTPGTIWDRDASGPVGRLRGNVIDPVQPFAATDRPVFAATGPFTILCRFRPMATFPGASLYALGPTQADTTALYRLQLNGQNMRHSWVGGGWGTMTGVFQLEAHLAMISGWDGARAWAFRNGETAVNNAAIADSGAVAPSRLFVGASSMLPLTAADSFLDYIAVWDHLLSPPWMRALSADHRLIWSLFRARPERPFSAMWEARRGRRTLYSRVGSRGMRV
jgi:hypothetical protein